jgi:3-oxoadipate enol-lactonase
MSYAVLNGTRLYFELSGPDDAPVVVFINGIFQDTSGWALATRALQPRFRTLVYDCRGQGLSDKPEAGPYYSADHARELLALLDTLEIAHAHFVGLSNGGMILMHVARLAPERALSLAFVDTFAYLDPVQQARSPADRWQRTSVSHLVAMDLGRSLS